MGIKMREISLSVGFGKIKGLCWGEGNNKKILALHGWLDNAGSFHHLAPMLAEIGYEVIAIDFPGHGKSSHRAKGHFTHFIDFVLDVQEVLELLNWQKPILLGHSMGAAMAQMYATTNYENIEKLIMIENVGPVPSYEPGTAVSNLTESLKQWKSHSTKHKHFYPNVEKALKARVKATPMKEELLYPMVARGLKKTKKGYRWRTDKRLRLRSLFRFSEQIVQDVLSSEKPPTQLILADPITYALSYKTANQRIEKLNANETVKIKGHHHLHMDNAKEVFKVIKGFLEKKI